MQAPQRPKSVECRLKAVDLACRRGDRVLFSGLSLKVEPGGACHIVGANGIGKSSLIRILAGLAAPWLGSVECEGDVGLIDDRLGLDPRLPLGHALRFWAQIDDYDSMSPSARLGLSDLLDVPVRYLSTGQRKRAALARLIAQAAPIWLLDEPLNGLDRAAAELTMTLATEHLAAGGICIVASHQSFALPGMATLDLAEFAA
jgi:heme exporter protein A